MMKNNKYIYYDFKPLLNKSDWYILIVYTII